MARKKDDRNQILFIMSLVDPADKLDISKLADLDYTPQKVGQISSESSFLKVSKADDGTIFLYSNFEKRKPKDFENYVQDLLKKKGYGDRVRIDKVYNITEFKRARSVREYENFMTAIMSSEPDYRCGGP